MIETLRASGGAVSVTASTGAAAILVGGATLHSWAGVGLAQDSAEVLAAKVIGAHNKAALRRWRDTDTLVIDEVSMLGEGYQVCSLCSASFCLFPLLLSLAHSLTHLLTRHI